MGIATLMLLLFSFACSTVPAVTVTALPSVSVTNTPSPTPTRTPTATLQPSATPIPSATPTPLVTGLGQVIFSESFDDWTFPFNFNIYGPGEIEANALVMEREAGYQPPPDMWPTNGLYGIDPIPPEVTTVILFKAKSGTLFNIGYHNDAYGTDELRRFSYNGGAGTWDLYFGKRGIKHWNASQLRVDTWYYFSITRSLNGDITAKIWMRDPPKSQIEFHGNLGPEWSTLELTFVIDFRGGSFTLDEYQELR